MNLIDFHRQQATDYSPDAIQERAIQAAANFTCPRTCPAHRTHWCRFNALFRLLGTPRVHSHTVKVKVDMRDAATLERAVRNLKWEWHGQGRHKLYNRQTADGHGFQPPEWEFPIVLDSSGELHYDDYQGQWGNVADLDRLKSEYTMAAAQVAAETLGWQTERTDAGLIVHHPDGGSLTVSKEGICETTGFTGAGCHDARHALGLLADGAITNKPEFHAVAAQVQTFS